MLLALTHGHHLGLFLCLEREENDLIGRRWKQENYCWRQCGIRLGPGLLFCPLSEWFRGLKYKGYGGKTNGVLGDAPFSRAHSPTELKSRNVLNPRSLWFFPLQMKLKPSFTLFSVWNSVPNLGTAHFQNLCARWLKGWLWGSLLENLPFLTVQTAASKLQAQNWRLHFDAF